MNSIKHCFFILLLIGFYNLSYATGKKPVSHQDYASWKSISEYEISNDGNFLIYVINPQEGDGWLYIRNLSDNKTDSVPRAYKAKVSPNSSFIAFRIKPQFDTLRQAKLKKTKKEKLPKDSIGIYNLQNGNVLKYANVKSFSMAKENSDFLCVLLENQAEKTTDSLNIADSTKTYKKSSGKKDKKQNRLLIINPVTNHKVVYEKAGKYAFSENGDICAFTTTTNDSIDSVFVKVFNTQEGIDSLLFSSKGYCKNISLDKNGSQIAFTFSSDTVKNKAFGLYYYGGKQLKNISGNDFSELPEGMSISTSGRIYFNESGTELYFGISDKPEAEVKDTLTKDEKISLDIWTWHDQYLQPMQLLQADKERKRSYASVYYPETDNIINLGNKKIENVFIDKKAKGNLVLASDNHKYRKEISWDGSRYYDYYLIDRTTGKSKNILTKVASTVSLSPQQNYVAWYSIADSSWNIYDVGKGKSFNLSSKLNVNFYYELNDVPNEAPNYGMAGWTAEEDLVVYDNYDLWQFDCKNVGNARNITKSYGRKNKRELRYVKLDKESRILPSQLILSVFDKKNKYSGYLKLSDKNKISTLIFDDFAFSGIKKAKNKDVLVWRKQSFVEYNELYVSNTRFKKIIKVSNTNPQQKDYNWGTAELVDFQTIEGDSMQGILYKPEDFDPSKKYPMLVYFYERYTDRLHRHYVPAPIRSVINFTYYASNGYLVFVPDIKYKTGYPGPSAVNCIVGGTESLIKQYDFIDKGNIGIQGQSWGGYQTAFIVTQTDIYKAAMAGAPVSNMTSAYGGIRWGSGMSRAFQYEETQSRIGATLWERQDLYILNSPLFFAPNVNTPLLMMHNDKDGAVPWYQGIEYFNALRRLDKPVWMLVYNGAPHNLKRRADMKDLTVRMQQFFDHYLKGAPEPRWMKSGIPAIEKGKDPGFELSE
ncbi:MAG: S9 family peptidase [Chlorobi bacterium]|nr:S9 family peptidase [Chlorobiota bacterium]